LVTGAARLRRLHLAECGAAPRQVPMRWETGPTGPGFSRAMPWPPAVGLLGAHVGAVPGRDCSGVGACRRVAVEVGRPHHPTTTNMVTSCPAGSRRSGPLFAHAPVNFPVATALGSLAGAAWHNYPTAKARPCRRGHSRPAETGFPKIAGRVGLIDSVIAGGRAAGAWVTVRTAVRRAATRAEPAHRTFPQIRRHVRRLVCS